MDISPGQPVSILFSNFSNRIVFLSQNMKIAHKTNLQNDINTVKTDVPYTASIGAAKSVSNSITSEVST